MLGLSYSMHISHGCDFNHTHTFESDDALWPDGGSSNIEHVISTQSPAFFDFTFADTNTRRNYKLAAVRVCQPLFGAAQMSDWGRSAKTLYF